VASCSTLFCASSSRIPQVIWVLAMGIMWGNIPSAQFLTGGITRDVRRIVSQIGLTTTLIRGGLSMNVKTMETAAPNICALAVFPMLAEVLVHGFMATALMDYGGSRLWPFLQAMTSAPVAVAIVTVSILYLRTQGYTLARGPSILIIPVVILELSIGVWGINFMLSLVFRNPADNLGWAIAQGPVQIVVGAIVGILLGIVWAGAATLFLSEAERLPHGKFSRSHLRNVTRRCLVVLAALCLTCVFFGYRYNVAAGGCMACALVGATVSYFCSSWTDVEEFKDIKAKIAGNIADVWDFLVMPALFSIAGSSISVATMFRGDFIWRSILCVVCGASARALVAFLCALSYDLTPSERVLHAIGSCGRATVQVALGSASKLRILDMMAANPAVSYATELRYSEQVYDVAITAVLICGPLSAIILSMVAPHWWPKDAAVDAAKSAAPPAAQPVPSAVAAGADAANATAREPAADATCLRVQPCPSN